MIDLDQQIRDGLVDASADVGASRPADLAFRLVAIRTRRRRTTRRRALALAAAIVLIAGMTVAVAGSRHGDQAQVITGPGEPKGFADLGPGWHVLDTGPVPGMSRAVLAWTGHELLVAGSGAMYAYDPNTAAWQRLAPPPFEPDGMVWTGEALVATGQSSTGGAPALSAWWDPTGDQWHDIGTVPVAPGLVAAGSRGPTSNDYGDSLVWTGQRVIDSTHGAVLDPGSWRWSDLAMPSNVIAYSGLLTTNPVWDGHEQAGLAWSALGTSYREVPGVPAALTGEAGVSRNTSAVAAAGSVVLVPGTDTGRAAELDPTTGSWTALPRVPGMRASEGCPKELASVGEDVLVAPCDGSDPLFLRGGRWQTTGPQPDVPADKNGFAWHGVWLGVDGAVIAWSTSTDAANEVGAPYVEAIRTRQR
jgi:hypothetical protein